MKMTGNKRYVLFTAAKNEAAYIEYTLKSVLAQAVLPVLWVIVNDGSTDATEDIVRNYAARCDFIHLISNPESEKRNFAAKAKAVKQALAYLEAKDIECDYIGNLDADVSFESFFYEKLIERMNADARLGIIGGLCHECRNDTWTIAHSNPEWAVGGATQFFRFSFFKQINGYPFLPFGGEDTVVEYLVREKGYIVTALNGVDFFHHKGIAFSKKWNLKVFFKQGIQEYMWGSGIIFEFFKCISRFFSKPYIIGGVFRLSGYIYARLIKKGPSIPQDIIAIIQKQQTIRLITEIQKRVNILKVIWQINRIEVL